MDGHDNDADKANGNSETQGIFSTPDLAVDAENITPTASENSRSRVASIFANTDAGQRSQRLNDAMEANTITSAPATEDIKIDNGPRKRSKTPLVIALVAVVMVVGGLVAWTILNHPETPINTGQETIQESKKEFVKYATYLLYGEKRNELSGEFSSAVFYALDENMVESEDANQYWNNLLSQLQISIDTFNSIESKDQYLASFLEIHQQNMLFLDAYRKLGEPSDESIIRSYVTSGDEKTQNVIREYYINLTRLDQRSMAETFYNDKIDQYEKYLNVLQAYQNAGCLNDSSANQECIDSLVASPDDDLLQALLDFDEATLTAQSVIDDTIRTVESDCWRINSQFNELLTKESESNEEQE